MLQIVTFQREEVYKLWLAKNEALEHQRQILPRGVFFMPTPVGGSPQFGDHLRGGMHEFNNFLYFLRFGSQIIKIVNF